MRFRFLFILIAGLSGFDAAAKETLTVLTAYHEEVVALFETAFERDNPDIDVQILWRMPHDALPYLRKPAQGGVDVYWSASQHNFQQLKREDAWQKLAIDRAGLADSLGALPLADPDGYYRATEMAGYGFAVNPGYLQKHDLPLPKTWRDLADSRYSGHLVLPVPSKLGFAPLMIDSVLQQHGWEKGWALLAEITANAQLIGHGGAFLTDIIGSGERGIAPSMDFFVASAQANGAPLNLIYPEPVAYSPAHIAITAATQQADAAKRFVTFVLSETGQKLLFHPDIRKLPVRVSVYADKPAHTFDPFEAAVRHPPVYDPSTATPRLALNNTLFDLLFTEREEAVRNLWQRLRKLEDRSGGDAAAPLDEIRRLLTAVPIDGINAGNIETQRVFRMRANDADAERQAQKLERTWRAEIDGRLQKAERLLTQSEH